MPKSHSSTREKILQEYQEKLKRFVKEVATLGDETKGIPAPHIPIAGKCYDIAKYKIAFVGMETAGWEDLDHFLKGMESNPSSAVLACQDWLNPQLLIKHSNPVKFWGFIIHFLERFYHIEHNELMNKKDPHPILTSFVWAETNSIERYHVTAEKNNVKKEVWQRVKKLSKPLDSINHLINATQPDVIIITDKYVSDDYLLKIDDLARDIPDTNSYAHTIIPDQNLLYKYYYLAGKHTHIFVIPHPHWIGMHGKTKEYIESIIEVMQKFQVWASLPSCDSDWKKAPRTFSTIERHKFIADLANFLVDNDTTMTSNQLVELLNSTGFRTQKGYKYKVNSRAILTKLVQPAWKYYYSLNQYQIANNISKAYTNKWGILAWE